MKKTIEMYLTYYRYKINTLLKCINFCYTFFNFILFYFKAINDLMRYGDVLVTSNMLLLLINFFFLLVLYDNNCIHLLILSHFYYSLHSKYSIQNR